MPRVFEIDGGKAKHDYATGGYQAWLDKVCAIRLDKLTPDRINDWKVRELKAESCQQESASKMMKEQPT